MRIAFRFANSLCVVLAVAFVCAGAADAYTVKSPEGGISAEFKAEPAFTTAKETAKDGQTYQRFQWLLDEGAIAWVLSYNDYKPGTVARTTLSEFYEAAAKGSAAGTGGRQIGEMKSLTLSGISGRELLTAVGEKTSEMRIRQRMFTRNDRFYQILYVGPAGTENSAAARAFLDSLRID
jgi:hypothetical protein